MPETTSNKIETYVPQNAQDQVPSSSPEQKTPALDNFLENIKKIPPNYREGYGKKEAKEDGTPMVDIRTYNLEWENVYGKYAKTTPDELIFRKKT